MAIPSTPATPEQMQIEAIQELDRMRTMSIQALAMQRIRDSVMTLSRETGFRERPVEAFSQAPLYIPQYQQWSNTQQKLVGTPPPTKPIELSIYSSTPWQVGQQWFIKTQVERRGQVFDRTIGIRPELGRYLTKLSSAWQAEYGAWEQAQRNLPT